MKWTCKAACFSFCGRHFNRETFSNTPASSSCRCCRAHDKCYETSRKTPGCTALADLPYVLLYDFTCSNERVTCSGEMIRFQACARGGILQNASTQAIGRFPDSPVSPQRPTTSAKLPCASAIGWRLTASLRTHTTLKTRTWIAESTVSTESYKPQNTHTRKLDF